LPQPRRQQLLQGGVEDRRSLLEVQLAKLEEYISVELSNAAAMRRLTGKMYNPSHTKLKESTVTRLFMLLFLLPVSNSLAFAAGSPELLIAIRNGDHAQVQRLLRAGADVNTAKALQR